MRHQPKLLVAAGILAAVPLGLMTSAPPGAAVPPASPMHTLAVVGVGVGSFPAFDPAIERYAVTTTDTTGGSLAVHASTSDPAGVIRVDGRIAVGGVASGGSGAGEMDGSAAKMTRSDYAVRRARLAPG